ncbi:hypothetical protein [Leclercia sp. W17]|uniref:hypothetical protein n=1 Tax=Leclercia sp. W17 TaxID=2282309 RepID=UPI001AF02296|nr:hypothetical protein [Leclercia sp. W17]
MLTFKHFMNRPTWAAAAGYPFNYFDCMSYTAGMYGGVFVAIRNVFYDFFGTELRELPLVLAVLILASAGIVLWPLIFWVAAIWIWIRCRHHRSKYHLGGGMTEIARKNLNVWKVQLDRDFLKESHRAMRAA